MSTSGPTIDVLNGEPSRSEDAQSGPGTTLQRNRNRVAFGGLEERRNASLDKHARSVEEAPFFFRDIKAKIKNLSPFVLHVCASSAKILGGIE